MKRVAVLTTFVHLMEAYSLCKVVETHVRTLLANGYPLTFVACEGFQPQGVYTDPRLRHWRVPVCLIEDDSQAVERPQEYRAKVQALVSALRPLMVEIDVAITHDFAYLPQYLAYNQACRELADEFPHVTWLHFIHSAPWSNPGFATDDPRSARFSPFPHGWLLYPNEHDVPRVAAQYGVPLRNVKVVPHPVDWEAEFGFHPLTRALVREFDLYSPDVLAIYPIRMDKGKRPEELVRLFAALKSRGVSVRLMIINFHSRLPPLVEYRDAVVREREKLGLTDREVIFTNQIESLPGIPPERLENYRYEFPHRVILDLFHLTNIYVHPSTSESYSLVCQEAVACGNLLFLNQSLAAMKALYGADARYVEFSPPRRPSSDGTRTDFSYAEAAEAIITLLHSDPTVRLRTQLRQERNVQAFFRKALEPLLYLAPE
ncbi:glycosyltransferase family 4 protein [Mumia zhuanghuii]|uniref:Glycosyltransferase family 4 protein n=1 Tax=Mumia zhuanghuii TaxID=2585211 RepID=A0A5C4MG96_9ACTN|nr:glycosyltransferase family 4 protein [Mumia zhuanghuii]TNC38827.1 glycosyltransferase family 4 protein [Mumia zhuanghuii]TNC51794.1 glycosyltransferase family 4 protein [Mumia zhuanghuii]